MHHHPTRATRATRAALAALAVALLAACGGSDGSDGSAGSSDGSGTATEAAAVPGDETADGAEGGSPTDVPTSGLSYSEAMNADDLTAEQRSELQITLSVLGIDHPGYVAGSTIVAITTEDDPEDRQFTCIAAGQVDQDEYEVVVIDEGGDVLDC